MSLANHAAVPVSDRPQDEFSRLIEGHQAAYEKWRAALSRLDDVERAYEANREPVKIPISTGHLLEECAFSGMVDCRGQVSGFYACARLHVRTMGRIAPDIAAQYEAALEVAEQENLALVDRIFAEEEDRREASGLTAAENAEADASEAEDVAMMALLAFPPQTIEQAQRRARYLMTTRYRDTLCPEAAAFLQSFMGDQSA